MGGSLVSSTALDLQEVEVFLTTNATGRSGSELRPEQMDVGARHDVSR